MFTVITGVWINLKYDTKRTFGKIGVKKLKSSPVKNVFTSSVNLRYFT
jgi:hypothetical protein